MTNVFIFHGTEGHPQENWFPWLKQQLETQGCKVYVPQFPSPPIIAAKINEWFGVLDKYKDQLNEDTILVGHSLGGIFALRVLEQLDHPVRAVFLVGTPIGEKPILNYERDSSFSGFNFDWGKIKKNSKHFEVFHSNDDPYVDLSNGKKLAEQLGVKLNLIPNAGHFNARAGYLKFEKLLEKLQYSLGK